MNTDYSIYPDWYKDVIIYETHVKVFCDSNNDGIGDFQGLTSKLDYLSDLGINAIWLLPFYPSPLRDDGYDIADYKNIHPIYGTMKDFKKFLKESHKRNIYVITELVINHTSSEHLWFKRARKSPPGSNFRNYYVWNENPNKYKDARIIFKDFENSNWTWDPKAKAYYWHRFYSHQPDLNFDNPNVKKEVFKIMDFWFKIGVDGVRLDAIPYLYEREGTNCENLKETFDFLRELRAYVDKNYKNKMLLAEANQWPEDAVAYFGNQDMCHMAFHFPLMPRMFMALKMEDRFPIIDIMEQTPEIDEHNQWAIFLRNHDELTLEMVTDEERDYMYRVYAADPKSRINLGIRRRLAPLLNNNRKQIELLNILLLTMKGTPVLYYGDEIGMGDNYYLGDRDGVRTPMQWNGNKNAGFSEANPHKLYLPVIIDPEYHYETINVETQETNISSLLWWIKKALSVRKNNKTFGRGSIRFIFPENNKILAYIRTYKNNNILIAVNLSNASQSAEFDLAEFSGYTPQEIFSHNSFTRITSKPYILTFTPYGYYILKLKENTYKGSEYREEIPHLSYKTKKEIFSKQKIKKLLKILPDYIKLQRWYGSKDKIISTIKLNEHILLNKHIHFIIIKINFIDIDTAEYYAFPISLLSRFETAWVYANYKENIIAEIDINGTKFTLFESIIDRNFHSTLLTHILQNSSIKGQKGLLKFFSSPFIKKLKKNNMIPRSSTIFKTEQSNSSILFKETLFMKLYRKIEEGINPEIEILEFLSSKKKKYNLPIFAGKIIYSKNNQDYSISVIQNYVQNEKDAWAFILTNLEKYFNDVITNIDILEIDDIKSYFSIENDEKANYKIDDIMQHSFVFLLSRLAQRIAEFHTAMSDADKENLDYYPEDFSLLYQRSLYQETRVAVKKTFEKLRKKIGKFEGELRKDLEYIIASEKKILSIPEKILKYKLSGKKIRIHGDFHLGQILFTGNNFTIIDFEGEPDQALSERKIKRSPLKDIAGIIRSFEYALYYALYWRAPIRQDDRKILKPWAQAWQKYVVNIFLKEYLKDKNIAKLIPDNKIDIQNLLNIYILQKVIYEINYELNHRPEWVYIPVKSLKELIKDDLK